MMGSIRLNAARGGGSKLSIFLVLVIATTKYITFFEINMVVVVLLDHLLYFVRWFYFNFFLRNRSTCTTQKEIFWRPICVVVPSCVIAN